MPAYMAGIFVSNGHRNVSQGHPPNSRKRTFRTAVTGRTTTSAFRPKPDIGRMSRNRNFRTTVRSGEQTVKWSVLVIRAG